ncbi:MAG TPA: hypothetical protein VNA29_06320 [Sphingomicrobium sp.]|nr:hypothetical protein [Sphingomicrobium sp.]
MKLLSNSCAVLLAIGVTACGSKPESEGNGATAAGTNVAAAADPCTLVTAEEVGAILGDTIVATSPTDGGCTYETADAQASSVTIELDQADAKGAMDVARSAAGVLGEMGAEAAREGGAAGEEVNGMLSDSGDTARLGDEAFFGPNQQLSIRKGNSYIAIQPPMMKSRMAAGNPMLSAGDKKKLAIAIAEKAVARLP